MVSGLLSTSGVFNATAATPLPSTSELQDSAHPISPTPSQAMELTSSMPLVDDLADTPPDWTVQQLQSLGDRYGCGLESLSGSLPTQPMTRAAFGVGLQDCLSDLVQLAHQGRLTSADAEAIVNLQRLQAEFAPELALLSDRLAFLDRHIVQLEDQQFSPTAKLEGEVIFAAGRAWGEFRADDRDRPIEDQLFLGNRVELTIEASLTGDDELGLTLEGRDIPELEEATGTAMANLGFDGDDDNELVLDELEYQFPLTDQAVLTLSATGGSIGDYAPTLNALFNDSAEGSISTFGRENPIRRQGSGTGIGFSYDLSDAVNLSLGYVANRATELEQGFSRSPYGAIAQLTLRPSDTLETSLTYVRSYNNLDTGTGSALAAEPFGDDVEATVGNSWGAELTWQPSDTFSLGGRIGWIQATAADLPDRPEADLLTWAILLSLTDVSQEGDAVGFIVGQPLRVIHNQLGDDAEDPDASLHLEAFYRFPVTDNVVLTPGFFVILAPEHSYSNDPIYVGTLRTTFKF